MVTFRHIVLSALACVGFLLAFSPLAAEPMSAFTVFYAGLGAALIYHVLGNSLARWFHGATGYVIAALVAGGVFLASVLFLPVVMSVATLGPVGVACIFTLIGAPIIWKIGGGSGGDRRPTIRTFHVCEGAGI